MAEPTRLSTADVAARLGMEPSSWRAARSRRPCPPDGYVDSRTPYWFPATIDVWRSERPRPGRPTTKSGAKS